MGLRAALQAFPLETLLQLLSATEGTGRLEVRGDKGEGWLGLSRGRLVSAEFEDTTGDLALGALFAVAGGDVEFVPGPPPEREDLSGDLDPLLDRAVAERDRIAAMREVIPSDRVRFRLSDRAAERAQITLTPDQWRTLLTVDGARDVAAIAEKLDTTRLSAQDVLAGLVRAGLVDTLEPHPVGDERHGYRRFPPLAPIPPTTGGEAIVLRGDLAELPLETIVQLLAATRKTGRLETHGTDEDSSTLGFDDGRLVSASAREEDGDLALGAAFTTSAGEFDFIPMAEPPPANLAGGLEELLDRAAALRERIGTVRALISSDRARLVLSERAARNPEISLTPEQWRALLAVNPQRDVAMVAEELRMRRLPTMMLLADLIRGGFVDVLPADAELSWPYVERRRAPWQQAPVPSAPAAEPEPEAEPEVAAAEAPAEEPLEETVIDRAPSDEDRLAALSGIFGPAEPVPPPPAWLVPAEAEPETPAEIDPRLAAVEAPVVEPEPVAEAEPSAWPEPTRSRPEPVAGQPLPQLAALEDAPPVTALPEKKKGGLLGGLFGGVKVVTPPTAPGASTRAGQLALLANELITAYNSGQYGKGKVEDRMIGLLMRVDEQADPIDRPIPVASERIDVSAVDAGVVAEPQAVPYLATLVRQVYDDAEKVLGKDKARRGFRDVRDRVLGKDLALLQAPEVVGRMPKV